MAAQNFHENRVEGKLRKQPPASSLDGRKPLAQTLALLFPALGNVQIDQPHHWGRVFFLLTLGHDFIAENPF